MGDDGSGQYIAFHLEQRLRSPKVKVINGGIVPEERFQEVVDFGPEALILIDAVDSGRPKGEVALYDDTQMMNYLPISSHSLPLPIFIDRCKRNIEGLTVKLLGIQPFSLKFLDHFALYMEETYSLSDKEENPNIPFYAFNLTEQMEKICETLIDIFITVIKENYHAL
jgi:hydrogenase maturation protease